jgi:hypothetical protein
MTEILLNENLEIVEQGCTFVSTKRERHKVAAF